MGNCRRGPITNTASGAQERSIVSPAPPQQAIPVAWSRPRPTGTSAFPMKARAGTQPGASQRRVRALRSSPCVLNAINRLVEDDLPAIDDRLALAATRLADSPTRLPSQLLA